MTASPTIQTQPLSPVPSGVSITILDSQYVGGTWNKWFVDLREKVNVINQTLASWSGIAPVSGLTPGTYGDTTHYPIVTINQYGMITAIVQQSFSSGGGSPIHITNVSATYTVALADVPASSSSRGMIVVNADSANTIELDTFANTSIPIGADLLVYQKGTGATSIIGLSGVSLIGPTISGGGQNSLGRAIQIATDAWAISGDLAWTSGNSDPYWSNVFSLVYFNGTVGSNSMVDQVSGITWANYGIPVISSTESKFNGTSGYFNGSAGIYINKQAAIGTEDFTVDVWLYTTITLGSNTVFCSQQDSSTSTVFQLRGSPSGALEVLFRPNGGGSVTTIDGSTVITVNVWHLLSVSRVSGTVYIFLDGNLQTSATFSGNLNCSAETFTYGCLSDGSGAANSFITGYLNSCRITVGVGRYTTSFTPPTMPFPNS